MFPDGATKNGIHDLGAMSGRTSTPTAPTPASSRAVQGREGAPRAPCPPGTPTGAWPGGSYQNDRIAARCTTRRGTDRYQRTGIGPRRGLAQPGKDLCERLYEREVRNSRGRSIGTEFNTSTVFAMDRWQAKATAFTGVQSAKLKRRGHHSKYEVPSTTA